MSGPTIRTQIACTKCGYDLEGLEAQAKCPECAQDIMVTLAARLDPATESLARTRALVRVAWGVYLACIGSVLGCAVAAPPILGFALDSVAVPAWLAPGLRGAQSIAPFIAVAGTLAGLIGLVFVLPWERRRAMLRARVIGGAGFAGWGAIALMTPGFDAALGTLGAIAAVVAALTPLLRELVPYSRMYRSARHATQTTRDLVIAAGVTLGAGGLALFLARTEPGNREVILLATVGAYGSAMFLMVGLCYRLANVHWALRSVRRPPPKVDEVLR
ncbi:MAG: hypothetical protein RLZZ116_118 [Planctomycetota bacterium]|jgi:hypothetical protein